MVYTADQTRFGNFRLGGVATLRKQEFALRRVGLKIGNTIRHLTRDITRKVWMMVMQQKPAAWRACAGLLRFIASSARSILI